jgi:uncharacterized protein
MSLQLVQLKLPSPREHASPIDRENQAFSAEYRIIETPVGPHIFIADQSRLYAMDNALSHSVSELHRALGELIVLNEDRAISLTPIAVPPLRSLSLNVAQACNMACSYCYADEGRFGGKARLMSEDIAFRSIDRLMSEAAEGEPVVVGFMGGEPMLHRELVHAATRYAASHCGDREVRFSLTTNGTLLNACDIQLFHEFPFTVQISIDGDRNSNDHARPMLGGGSSYDRIIESLKRFSIHGRPKQLSARVTVTPLTRDLPSVLRHVMSLGFDDVGFAPVVVSPNFSTSFSSTDFESFLADMIACGRIALDHLKHGRPFPFTNFLTAIDEIHKGTHRPYPCGAGAAYLSVNAEGEVYACHRLIDDPAFAMGNVRTGLDQESRSKLLARMHVDRMEPCRGCWARYLCGGGCYHEVTRRGRLGCDYIRGWIEFCISAYAELSSSNQYTRFS